MTNFDMYSPSGWWELLSKKPGAFSWGGVEIMCLGPHDPTLVAAACAGMFGACRGEDDALVFQSMHVVYPVDIFQHEFEERRFYEALVPQGAADTAEEVELYRSRAMRRALLHFSDSLDGYHLVEKVSSFPKIPSVVLVVEADIYEAGFPAQQPSVSVLPSQALERLPEITTGDWGWSDRLARLAEALVRKVAGEHVIVVLISSQYGPVHEKSKSRLLGVDGTGVLTVSPPSDEQIIGERGRAWTEKLHRGDVESILDDIDQLNLSAKNNALVKAQVLSRGGTPVLAFKAIESQLGAMLTDDAPPLLKIKLALIAFEAGKQDYAKRFLQSVLASGPRDEATLNMAIELARNLRASEELSQLRARAARLLPLSETTIREEFEACLTEADYKRFAHELQQRMDNGQASSYANLLLYLGKAFAGAEDTQSLLESIRFEFPQHIDIGVLMVARRDLRRGSPLNTINICAGHPWTQNSAEQSAIQLVFAAIESVLLSKSVLGQDEVEHLRRGFSFVSAYLHANPTEIEMRNRFSEVVSPQVAGAYGYLLLADRVALGPKPKAAGLYEHPAPSEPIPIADFMAFFEKAMKSMANIGFIIVGSDQLFDTVGYEERRLLDSIWELVKRFSLASDEAHCDFMLKLLHVGRVLAARLRRPGEAIDLAGRVAIGMALSGYAQRARDIAEHILGTVPDDEDERVFGWLEYAEIYVRCGRPHDAIVWLAVALARIDRPWPPTACYHVANLAARVLRDLGLYDLALEAIEWAKSTAKTVGLAEFTEGPIEAIECSVQIALLHQNGITTPEGEAKARALIRQLSLRLRDRGSEEELLPFASLLAEAVLAMSSAGLDVGTISEELRGAAESLHGHARSLLLSMINPPATSQSIADFARGLTRTRYPEYASTDVSFAPILAKRALARSERSPASERLALLEWLTDRSVQAPDKRDSASEEAFRRRNSLILSLARGEKIPSAFDELILANAAVELTTHDTAFVPADADTLEAFSAELSAKEGGIDIHVFALVGGTDKEVALVSAVDGHLVNGRVLSDVFSPEAFWEWQRKYPYGYGVRDPRSSGHDLNDFERTLIGIGLPLRETQLPALLVPEAKLQIIPPNLVLSGGRLSGLSRPMASAPSLTWLRAVQQLTDSSVRRVAWIPVPSEEGTGFMPTALSFLQAAIQDTLEANDFTLYLSPDIPESMEKSELAVIGAHGGVHDTTYWFRSIADESQNFLSPAKLAKALFGSRIVVLFVCSAGRLDLHPFASAAMGLPQMLLSHGCRAVLASPWPLDISVPKHWLPAFLAMWESGATVTEANFLANKAIEKSFSFHPAHRLAMNLFGDPLVRKLPGSGNAWPLSAAGPEPLAPTENR